MGNSPAAMGTKPTSKCAGGKNGETMEIYDGRKSCSFKGSHFNLERLFEEQDVGPSKWHNVCGNRRREPFAKIAVDNSFVVRAPANLRHILAVFLMQVLSEPAWYQGDNTCLMICAFEPGPFMLILNRRPHVTFRERHWILPPLCRGRSVEKLATTAVSATM